MTILSKNFTRGNNDKFHIVKRIPFGCNLIILILFLSWPNENLLGQCTNSSSYGSVVAPTSGTVTISGCSYQTEYSTISSIVAGATYTCTIATGGYITIRSGTYNGTVVAYGNSPLQWTAPTSDTYYAHWNTNSSCGTATNCLTTTITYGALINSTPPSSITGTSSICFGQGTTLTVNGGSLGTGASWVWYSSTCGGTLIGSGNSITIYPTSTTTYFVRAEGVTNTTSCASITISVGTPGTVSTTGMPSGTSVATTPATPGAALGLAGGLTYTYSNPSWPTCVNWGLPTTVAAVNLYNAGPTCTSNNLTFDAANAETNLTLGKACFTGTYNYYCVNTGGSYHLNDCRVRMRVVVTKSDGTTPLPFVLIGTNIMLQAKENFIVKVYIEGYAWIDLSGCIWSGTDYYSTSVNGGWPGVVDIFNSLHTDPSSIICTQFSPQWYTINSSATATSNSPVCVGNTLNLTSSSTLGTGCYANWTGPNGFTSTLQNPSITGVTTSAAGTYNLIISDGKVCYGTAATTPVTVNTNSTDPTSINAVIN